MIPEYISAEEYSRRSKLGVEEVKKQCNLGKIEHLRTEKGYYKIKVYDNDVVPKEQYENLLAEKVKLETQLANIKAILV